MIVNNNGGVKVETYIDREVGTNLKAKVISPCQASFLSLLQRGHSLSSPLPDHNTGLL